MRSIHSEFPIQSTKKGTNKDRNIVDPTITDKCSQPAAVVRKPMAADVDVGPGADDGEEAPPCQFRKDVSGQRITTTT
jgi:hypothetical protein